MKLRDAETLLQIIKRDGPITEHWEVMTDEGILLEAEPTGIAIGAYYPFLAAITARARTLLFGPLYAGVNFSHEFPVMSRFHLWQQERYVYEQEKTSAVRRAIEQLDGMRALPRIGEKIVRNGRQLLNTDVAYDIFPHPEDFGLFFNADRHWGYGGMMDVSKIELARIKAGFCDLLENFVSN